ncbi:MAG: oligosaccharide flippase family protein [Balneolaceae bacterium]
MNFSNNIKSYFINVATLSSGTILANLITIVATLFLTRLFTPQEIGYLTFFNSSAIVLANIFTLGYEFAIVTPKKSRVALHLTLGASALLFFFSIILSVLVLLILLLNVEPDIGLPVNWFIFLPFAVLILGFINISQEWFTRTEQYKLLSVTKTLQSLATAIPQILIGYYFLNSIGLVIGYIVGRATSSIVYVWKFIQNKLTDIATRKSIFSTLKEYKRYPKYISPTIIIDRLSLEAPYFLISFLFGESALGFFAISYRVLSVPMTFIGSAVGQVFFKFLARKKNKAIQLSPALIKTWLALSIIGILPIVVILVGGADLFQIVFGEEWGFSGTLAILLVPMLYLDFISSPTGRSFLVLNLEHYSPVFSFARITYVCGSIIVGYYFGNILLAVLLLSLSRALALIIQNGILFLKAKQHDAKLTL